MNFPGASNQQQPMGGMKSANSTFMGGGFGKTANNTEANEEDEDEERRIANNRMMNLESLNSKLNQLPVFS